LSFKRDFKIRILALITFLLFAIVGYTEYKLVQILVKIVCTSCVGLG